MRYLIVVFWCAFVCHGFGQQFKLAKDFVMPDSLASADPTWSDIDNDGLLDIVLISTSKAGYNYLQWIKGDTINSPILQNQFVRLPSSITGFYFTDYNGDNRIDIIISGSSNSSSVVIAYLNNGLFTFTATALAIPGFSVMKIADLDRDARQELILSGEKNGTYYFDILKQQVDLSWKIVHDTMKIRATAIQVFDANGDGIPDLFLSGDIRPDSIVTSILLNKGGLYFQSTNTIDLVASSSLSDLNSDGFFDVVTMGNAKAGVLATKLYQSNSGGYTIVDQSIKLASGIPLMADLNSDGVADVNYFGKSGTGDTLSLNVYGIQDYDTLKSVKVVTQQFGDMEHDGDLDLLTLSKSPSIHLTIYKNTIALKNIGPLAPKNGIALPVFNRTFMYWDKSTDDHTPKPAITYDLHLEGSQVALPGAFDLLNEKRLLVSHGNNGTQNFSLLRNVHAEGLQFAIQGVDNAFHAGLEPASASGSLCVGVGASCSTASAEKLSLCTNESITLVAPSTSLWFSFAKGYLGEHTELTWQDSQSDTLFYYNPAQIGCSGLKVYIITINNDTVKTTTGDKYACAGAALNFSAEPGWSQVSWKSILKGDLGTTSSIQYVVTEPDSIFLTLSNTLGCSIRRKTAIKISKPALEVVDGDIKIEKGSSVTLTASGAQRYEWTPIAGLDHADIASPVASPGRSTLYTVTGFDSLGCAVSTTVNVVVEEGGFIPNLFTPNDDGKNDELKVYGLISVKDFNLSIYNRDGAVVFKTSSVADAMQRGWDGTRNGSKQPPGVYFWKVKGEASTGNKILLNGKDSGSIVLVR